MFYASFKFQLNFIYFLRLFQLRFYFYSHIFIALPTGFHCSHTLRGLKCYISSFFQIKPDLKHRDAYMDVETSRKGHLAFVFDHKRGNILHTYSYLSLDKANMSESEGQKRQQEASLPGRKCQDTFHLLSHVGDKNKARLQSSPTAAYHFPNKPIHIFRKYARALMVRVLI